MPTRTGSPGLLSLAAPLRVLSPEAVRQALLRRTQELLEENANGQSP
ncbi:hypothetical protein ABTZ57_43260 [Streptomyces sp. NPDC094048]